MIVEINPEQFENLMEILALIGASGVALCIIVAIGLITRD